MINTEIKTKEVRLVSEEHKGTTVVKTEDALREAQEQGLDLICVSTQGDIPVVKIGDYSKYCYEKQKREKENKKKAKQNSQELKEIQISDSIAENDMRTKAKNVDRLLKEGNKVKLSIRYKGRMMKFINEGPKRIEALKEMVSINYKIDKPVRIDGNTVSMVLAPAK